MRNISVLLFCLFSTLVINGQELRKKLQSEKDGYNWYSVYSEGGTIFGIQNEEGKYVFYIEDDKHDYSCYYTNFNACSDRAFFIIGRKNRRIIPKSKKESKTYIYKPESCNAIVSLDGNIIIPFERGYESITYLTNAGRSYFYVSKGMNKTGVCDIHGNEIVKPEYNNVFYSVDGFTASTSSGYLKLGITLNDNNEVDDCALNKELYTDERTHFKYYLIYQNGKYGMADEKGNVLIPLSRAYTNILFRSVNDKTGYFFCKQYDIQGACDIHGKEIVPITLGCTSVSDEKYGNVVLIKARKGDVGGLYNSGGIEGLYGIDGEEIIPMSREFNSIYYNYNGKGYIYCAKGNKVGAYSLNGKEIVKPEYSYLIYTRNGFEGKKESGDNIKVLGALLPNHNTLYPDPKPEQETHVAVSKHDELNQSPQRNNNSALSLSYKRWESKFDKGYTEYVRESDGMVTETMHLNCVCLNGICKICAGLGVSGYGIFQTNCISCGGTGKCSFCGGTGTKVTTSRYRYIDEYYSNGASALHVTSSNSGPSVYRGGVGYAYYTYGNSKPIKDEGSYYSFGGETVYGVKTASFRLSKDYKTLWMGNDEYHLINKEEYDRIASITSKVTSGAMPVPSGGNPVHSTSGSSSSSHRSGGSSVYTNCTSCGGTGICPRCGGKKGSWQNTGYYTGNGSESWINCSGCNGSGKCSICYGRGKL